MQLQIYISMNATLKLQNGAKVKTQHGNSVLSLTFNSNNKALAGDFVTLRNATDEREDSLTLLQMTLLVIVKENSNITIDTARCLIVGRAKILYKVPLT